MPLRSRSSNRCGRRREARTAPPHEQGCTGCSRSGCGGLAERVPPAPAASADLPQRLRCVRGPDLGDMYSSLCSGILDVAASASDTTKVPLNAVWIAAWNDTPNIYGFGSPCALSDSLWNNHRRVHQYVGGHNESYGGATINIDTNA